MRFAAVLAAKSAAHVSRVLKHGSGTTYPGHIAERLHPRIIEELSSELGRGSVVVTGTNGKTTTSKMLGTIFETAGFRPVRNASGSNLRQGIAASLAAAAHPLGRSMRGDIGVLEVDEATMPWVASKIRPRVICVSNLFRDQLDRYGDLDAAKAMIGAALQSTHGSAVLLNADDPIVSGLAESAMGDVRYFGLDVDGVSAPVARRGLNVAHCPSCGAMLEFASVVYGHLGRWACPSCGRSRAERAFVGSEVELHTDRSAFTFTAYGASTRIALPMPGLHNVYNAVSACSCAVMSDVPLATIATALAGFVPPFGRNEQITVDGKTITLMLAKNPIGAERSLASALAQSTSGAVAFALNDFAADGKDISWIWDIDFESFNLEGRHTVLSGSRAEDLAVRLKYAGASHNLLKVCRDPANAVHLLAGMLPAGGSAHMLATYTAMLEIRNAVARRNGPFPVLGRGLGTRG